MSDKLLIGNTFYCCLLSSLPQRYVRVGVHVRCRAAALDEDLGLVLLAQDVGLGLSAAVNDKYASFSQPCSLSPMTLSPMMICTEQTTLNDFCLISTNTFAELTFGYHPNIGLNFDIDKLQMII